MINFSISRKIQTVIQNSEKPEDKYFRFIHIFTPEDCFQINLSEIN